MPQSSLPPPHILVVDDDAGLRGLVLDFLQSNGMIAYCARDGMQMQAALAAEPFDLIVLDLMLPGEDGLSLLRRLRATSTLPVIMLTAKGEETDRIVGLELGADDYLAKPFTRAIDVQMSRLRRKIEPGEGAPEMVKTVRGAGYMFLPKVTRA